MQSRQNTNDNLLKTQLAGLQNTPDPAIWNDEWKSKLDAKKQEMDDAKSKIMDDIRDCAARVAQEQGIDMIFSDYVGIGTAEDVTDDIIAKLAEEKLSMSDEDFQKEQQKQKQELDIYSAGLQRQFKSDLDQKLAEIAKDKEVGIIVDKRAVPNGGIDVTDEVIAKLQ